MIRNTEKTSLKDHRIPIKKQCTKILYVQNRPVQLKKISIRVQKWKINKKGKGRGPFQSHSASIWELWARLYLGGEGKELWRSDIFCPWREPSSSLPSVSLEEALITCTEACPLLFMMSELKLHLCFSLMSQSLHLDFLTMNVVSFSMM